MSKTSLQKNRVFINQKLNLPFIYLLDVNFRLYILCSLLDTYIRLYHGWLTCWRTTTWKTPSH